VDEMSAVGEKAVQAQAGIADLETALEKTQKALSSVEKVDLAAAEAKRKGSKLIKLLLIATVVGVTVIVAKKLMGGSGANPPATDPYGSSSTES
jgi:translation elongation factor EF-4